jgi:hypothetical protein
MRFVSALIDHAKTAYLSALRSISERLRRVAGTIDLAIADKGSGKKSFAPLLDEYVKGLPRAQNAIDVLPGWNHALPEHVGVVAGHGAFYNDTRILWAIQQFGSIEGRKILELGPLEASHTYMLEQHGAALIHAIEANKLSFLRCLVVKELLELKRARFFLGDFTEWLEQTPERYDFVIASGVLYHMQNPIRLLELLAASCDAFYLWTHYADDDAMPEGDPRRLAFVGDVETQTCHGIDVRMHKRSYHGAWQSKSFCGGMHDLHRWIEKKDILKLIHALGFADIRIEHDQLAHPNGPSFSIFARRIV